MSDRTYSQREIAAILARAADDQRQADHAGGPGLTLPELERAAAESGLDPVHVRQAAADLDAGLLALSDVPPGTAVAERWVDAPFREDVWEDAVAALQVQRGPSLWTWPGGSPAGASPVGASREWTHTDGWGVRTTLTASPRGDRTRVRVVTVDSGLADARAQALGMAAFLSILPAMLAGAGVAEGLGWGDLAGVLAVLVVLVAGTAAIAPALRRRVERSRAHQADEARGLADDVARQLGRASAPVPETPGTDEAEAAGGRLDVSVLDADPPDTESTSSGRRERA